MIFRTALTSVFLSIIAGVTIFILSPSLVSAQTSTTHWNVVEAGAKPDGRTDCTAIFQKLLDEAGKAGGGIVDVPAGQFRISSHLSIPVNVTLQGIYRMPPTSGPTVITNLSGSVLFAYEGRGSTNGAPFIQMKGNNSTIAGLIIAYPEWRQSDVPPIPYPPCVESHDTENVGVRDCLLLNPYEGIKFERSARHLIRNVTGYPSMRGIYVDECYDIGHIENVHFWPFGVCYNAENPYCKWVNTKGVAFELARTDWHYVINTFCFGYGIGYKFSASKHGSANGNFVGLGADSCKHAVVVDQAQPAGLLISNGEFVGRWSSVDSVCLVIGPNVEGPVSLVNCSFWGPIDRCVWMRSPIGQFTASACHFVNWDNHAIGSPAIQLDAGRAIIQGCTFGEENLSVQVNSNVLSAIITANQAEGGLRVENNAGNHTQMALNEQNDITWTSETRRHYKINLGSTGDARYLRGWHGAEKSDRPFRWTTSSARINLPVVPGDKYTITMETSVPQLATNANSGLYFDGQKIAVLQDGQLTASLPASAKNQIQVEIRAEGWEPRKIHTDTQDYRTLGIQAFSITMRSEKAGTNIFDANTGHWIGGEN